MISAKHKFILFNFLGLQFTWAACAYGATNEMTNFGVLVGLLYIFLHFIFTKSRLEDLTIVIIVASLGIALDYFNVHYNVISFNNDSGTFFLLPYWLVTLWIVFSLMIPHSLYWLSKHITIAFVAGAIGGSFSYWLGHELGALSLAEPIAISVAVYFIEWGIIFPASLIITKSFFKQRQESF